MVAAGVALLLGGCATASSPAGAEPAGPQHAETPPAAEASSDEKKEASARRQLIRGLTRARLGDPAEAVRHYENALQAAPEAPAVLSALAEALAAQGDFSTALYHTEQARRLAPSEPHYHRQLAHLHRRAGQPTQALDTYQALLARFPGDDEARLAMARLYAEQNRAKQALDAYETLAERTDLAPALYGEMLALYRRVGDSSRVEWTLKALIDEEPRENAHRRTLARFYQRQGRPQAAFPLLRKTLQHDPGDAEAAALLADAYRAAGRPEEASALKRRAAVPQDSASEPRASAGRLVERARPLHQRALDGAANAAEKATRLLERALEKDPAHGEALTLLGDLRFESGAFAEAAALLTRALAKNPRAPRRWARAAEAHLRADQPQQAATTADEGLLLFPGQVPLLRVHATALMRTGRDAEAASRLEEALRVMRTDGLLDGTDHAAQAARFHETLARLYARQGKTERAAQHRRQARALRERLRTASN